MAMAERNSPFAVLRERGFALFWAGQASTTIAGAMTNIAAAVIAYRLTGSALSVGLILIANVAPSLLIGLIAGALVDRMDPRRVMVVGRLIMALLAALTPLILPFGLIWLYVALILLATASEFIDAAKASILPEIVRPEQLGAANALMQINIIGAGAIGSIMAAAIMPFVTIDTIFYLDMVLTTLAALSILPLRVAIPAHIERTTLASIAHNLRAGARYLITTPTLRSLLIVTGMAAVGSGLANGITLPYIVKALGASEAQYGLVDGVQAAGFIIGGLLLTVLIDRLPSGQWTALSFLGLGLSGMALALVPTIGWALLLNLLLGIVNAPNYVLRSVIVQRETPRNARGRVSSAFTVARNAMVAAGLLAAGLADIVGVRELMATMGIIFLVSGAITFILPGLGRPSQEWQQALRALQGSTGIRRLDEGCAARIADLDTLATVIPSFASLGEADRAHIVEQCRVFQADSGTTILRVGETSNATFLCSAGEPSLAALNLVTNACLRF